MSAWRAVRVGDHAKHGILLEGRDGAGMQVQEAMAKEDHMVAGAVGTSLEPGARGVQMVEPIGRDESSHQTRLDSATGNFTEIAFAGQLKGRN